MNKINHQGANQLIYGSSFNVKLHKLKRTQMILMLSPTEARMI